MAHIDNSDCDSEKSKVPISSKNTNQSFSISKIQGRPNDVSQYTRGPVSDTMDMQKLKNALEKGGAPRATETQLWRQTLRSTVTDAKLEQSVIAKPGGHDKSSISFTRTDTA